VTSDIVKMLKAQIMPSNIKLKGYNNALIVNHGYVKLKVSHSENESAERFEVVDNGLCPILGLETSEALRIVKRIKEITTSDLLSKHNNVFEGIGCLSGEH